ncbi:MAG: phosphoribosyltransferase, partial [Ornithinibacter sp.]|nr:phosphoribosyltransferase [Ornithinibacter sp.]
MSIGGVGRLALAVRAAADLVLPARCAACCGPGGPLCGACSAGVRAASLVGGAGVTGPDPRPPGMPVCWAAARFEGALRDAVTAYKDEDRRDLSPVLADALATSVATALAADPLLRRWAGTGGQVLVVPLPSSRASRRRRGGDPVGDLALAAVARVAGLGEGGRSLVVAPALRLTRAVVDQSRLDRTERAENLAGALAVRERWAEAVSGSACILVDDVVTTGAT